MRTFTKKEGIMPYHGLTLQAIEEQWQERRYALVPNIVASQHVAAAIVAFQNFLALPLAIKQQYAFTLDEGDRGSRVGYSIKERDGGDTDTKEYFHFTLHAWQRFRARGSASVEALRLLEQALPIYQSAEQLVRYVVQLFELQRPGLYARFFNHMIGEYPHCYLRFLQYEAPPGSLYCAGTHADRSVITLTIAESAPGLRIAGVDGVLRPVERGDHELVLFPGRRCPEVFGHQAAWHDAVQEERYRLNARAFRWAIVFFCDLLEPNYLHYKDCHPAKLT